ncbi:unnamed protein product [Gongylonema pulchrum]|uniref:AcidPPc domain-containing protein n=1 Tax=Gongylonema pulchrum TaxID=637853 RepID=A0A183DYZ1_9BILA|nr:unnamed protein product [Gongylonema pulchrum]
MEIQRVTIGGPNNRTLAFRHVYSESAPGFTKGFETCPVNSHEYITDFECTGTDKYLVHESMLSFYSGHSAFSFYAAWYTALYLQARLYRPLFSRLLLPVVQFALFGGAAFVAYTRVSNYKHHWSDVLVGAIALFVAEVFSRREIPSCDAHCGYDEFGLAPVVRRAPLADVETGGGGMRNDGGRDGAQVVKSHNITVTREMAPGLNDIENNQSPPPAQTAQSQRL